MRALIMATMLLNMPLSASSTVLHPAVSVFHFPASRVGVSSPATDLGGKPIRPHAYGEDKQTVEGLTYDELYYGVTPRGFPAAYTQGSYSVNILKSDAEARSFNLVLQKLYGANQTYTDAPNQWVALSEIVHMDGSGGLCTVVSGLTFHNLQLTTYIYGNTSLHPKRGCQATKRWVLQTEKLLLDTARRYAVAQ